MICSLFIKNFSIQIHLLKYLRKESQGNRIVSIMYTKNQQHIPYPGFKFRILK